MINCSFRGFTQVCIFYASKMEDYSLKTQKNLRKTATIQRLLTKIRFQCNVLLNKTLKPQGWIDIATQLDQNGKAGGVLWKPHNSKLLPHRSGPIKACVKQALKTITFLCWISSPTGSAAPKTATLFCIKHIPNQKFKGLRDNMPELHLSAARLRRMINLFTAPLHFNALWNTKPWKSKYMVTYFS